MKHFKLCALLICPLIAGPASFTDVKDKNTIEIKTPDLSKREEAKIKLDNGLQVYIISDPGIDQSAAALAVDAGSWLDDPKYPGIAHYLEHLLFLGTKKYPEEDAFMAYVKSNGGLVNAYTATDRTVYMFSINNNAFDSALDQFSHFFIDPLFNPSGIGRELHAVDQENAKNIENDGWRQWMIFKATGNPESPNATFSTGNAETLGQIPPQEVRAWYEEHYSADQMHLFVYSNQPMETLKKLITQDFGPISNHPTNNTISTHTLTSDLQKGHITYVEPIKDLRQISFTWELPIWAIKNAGDKLPELVGYVLSSNSENSAEALLKKKGFAEGVYAGSMRLSDENAIFEIDVALTKQGIQNTDFVIDTIFESIASLKTSGVPEYIYNERKQMALTNYEWQTRENPFSFAMSTAGQLPYESLDTFPAQTYFYENYKPKELKKLINTLTPQTCMIMVTAPEELTGVKPSRQEKWLGGKYTIQPIPEQRLNTLANLAPNPAIGLPKANPFIPDAITIIPKSEETAPVLIADDEFGKTYYSNAAEFNVPEVDWTIGIKTPLIDGTPKHTALLDLYIYAAGDALKETLAYAADGGLGTSISRDGFSLLIEVTGFSSKANILLNDVINTHKTLNPSPEQFNIYKESILTGYQNQHKAMPFQQAGRQMSSLIYNDTPKINALEAALTKITYDDFKEFSQKLFSQVYTENLFAGNLTKDEAQTLVANLKASFDARVYPKADQNEQQVFLLNNSNGPYTLPETTSMQGNVAFLLIEQGPFSYKSAAAQEILGTALSDDFFKTLRTEQQTGYMARGWHRRVAGEQLQFFAVQSASHTPDDLLARFELFLETFVKDFPAKFSEERFADTKKGVVTTLSNPPTNLNELANRLYTFAFVKHDFDYLENIAAASENLTYNEAQTYATQFFSRKNKKRLALLLQGATTESSFDYREVTPLSLKSEGTYSRADN